MIAANLLQRLLAMQFRFPVDVQRVGTIGLKDKVEVKCGKVVEIDEDDAIMLLARYPNLIQIL